MAPTNTAAWYPSSQAPALEIGPTPYPTANAGEIIVKVAVAAFNPVDYKIQNLGHNLFPFLKFPYIGGSDISGTIVEVGQGVTRFTPGDRVLGATLPLESRMGAYQHYAALPAVLATRLPDDVSFEDAAVVPCCFATAAVALYDHLSLCHPTVPRAPSNGKAVLITAGASNVGSNAIKLAVASGYEVFTTSSPSNFAHCEALGARAFDYHSATVAQEIKDAFQGKECVGGFAVADNCAALVFDVVSSLGGQRVALTLPYSEDAVPKGVSARFIQSGDVVKNGLADVLFDNFLTEALAKKQFALQPKPEIVGKGLESVQAAFDKQKAGGVSCKKLVISHE
ncbi:GroES-like protein [Xylariaceae sp. FL1272]|nr:GroES-like protein [Xylariaceae sp. FL1272]